MPNLLDGVRVVESAVLLNGDTVGMLLGDLGADVIKVESPPAGDYLRYFLGQIVPGVSVPHAQVNRNKRSVLLDLTEDADRDTFWRLIDTADIFVDGNRPGVCNKLGVGPDAMRARKPSLVYVQHTGFGATGPYARIPTHGMLMNALVGAHALQRGQDGLLERGRSKKTVPTSVARQPVWAPCTPRFRRWRRWCGLGKPGRAPTSTSRVRMPRP